MNRTENRVILATVWLLVQTNRGNWLLMVYCDVDANNIDAEPMKDHKDNSMIRVYQELWAWMTCNQKEKPSMHILDNKASDAFKKEIRTNCNLQLVPPDTHHRNLAERAIQTFKSHFIAIFAGIDPSFPMSLWDWLVPQTVLMLNLLQQANKTPAVSVYHYVNGPFNYNAMPLATLGCKVQMHESKNRRKTWDPHSGTSVHHWNTTIATRFSVKRHAVNGSPILYSFNTNISRSQQ